LKRPVSAKFLPVLAEFLHDKCIFAKKLFLFLFDHLQLQIISVRYLILTPKLFDIEIKTAALDLFLSYTKINNIPFSKLTQSVRFIAPVTEMVLPV
jgi:hypothetical protein